jgi:hypothetical protein
MAAPALTPDQIIAVQALLAQQPPPEAQHGASPTNKEVSKRLADITKLFPTSGQRLPMPEFVLKSLPADPEELFKGNIPLVPALQMAISSTLRKTLQDSPTGQSRPGSLKYEAVFVLTNLSVFDLIAQWILDYKQLSSSVLHAHSGPGSLAELLEAPLSSLEYMQQWLTAIATGRLACIETFLGDGGKPAMESLNSRLFGSADNYTLTTTATMQHAEAVNAAILKEQVKEAAARVVRGSSGNNGGSGSSSRGRGRGGRGGGRTGANAGRGGNNEGSGTGAGADRT